MIPYSRLLLLALFFSFIVSANFNLNEEDMAKRKKYNAWMSDDSSNSESDDNEVNKISYNGVFHVNFFFFQLYSQCVIAI